MILYIHIFVQIVLFEMHCLFITYSGFCVGTDDGNAVNGWGEAGYSGGSGIVVIRNAR